MATTASDEPSVSAEEALKRQKKQARREAKLRLEIEAAKKELKKAQKKESKAQVRLEERSSTLYTLEARLEELRAQSSQAATDATSQIGTDAEPTSLLGGKSIPPEGTVIIIDAAQEYAMQKNETASGSAPASTSTRKKSSRMSAARTSHATKKSTHRSKDDQEAILRRRAKRKAFKPFVPNTTFMAYGRKYMDITEHAIHLLAEMERSVQDRYSDFAISWH